jgi:hypothetical protein
MNVKSVQLIAPPVSSTNTESLQTLNVFARKDTMRRLDSWIVKV